MIEILADEDVPAAFFGDFVGVETVGVGVEFGEEIAAGALKRNVNVPVSGASVALRSVYATV